MRVCVCGGKSGEGALRVSSYLLFVTFALGHAARERKSLQKDGWSVFYSPLRSTFSLSLKPAPWMKTGD